MSLWHYLESFAGRKNKREAVRFFKGGAFLLLCAFFTNWIDKVFFIPRENAPIFGVVPVLLVQILLFPFLIYLFVLLYGKFSKEK
ncbi:MAG: hypothetical protein D6780_02270 [Candidatus Dadabacteria bacterium]|nr:MAG: hypothetical protein D6780_02270 [Candidatus Dadabacteria bacterium]